MHRSSLSTCCSPRRKRRANLWKWLTLASLTVAPSLLPATAGAELKYHDDSSQKSYSGADNKATDENDLPPVVSDKGLDSGSEGDTGTLLGTESLADSLAVGAGAGFGSSAALANVGGYIDTAIIRTRLQFRYDNVTGGNSDRAEYLYGAYNTTIPVAGGGGSGGGGGQLLGPSRVVVQDLEYNEVSGLFEYALNPWLSGFVELPFRQNDIQGLALNGGDLGGSGIADLNAGVRLGLINECDRYVTFQLKLIAPSGDAADALGTGHTAIQPGLLLQKNYDRWRLFGEVHDWIGLGGTTFDAQNPTTNPLNGRRYAGNVLRYGLGAAYAVAQNECKDRQLFLVGEVVGWTVVDGLRTNIDDISPNNFITFSVHDANGDTIVNSKFGLRYTAGHHSLYAGYGFPVTGTEWYSDIFRVEYQYNAW